MLAFKASTVLCQPREIKGRLVKKTKAEPYSTFSFYMIILMKAKPPSEVICREKKKGNNTASTAMAILSSTEALQRTKVHVRLHRTECALTQAIIICLELIM